MRKLVLCCLVLWSGCGGCGDDVATEPDAEIVVPDASGDTVAPTTTPSPVTGTYRVLPEVTLTADEPATIYYTTDGSAPSTSSTSGASPVTVSGLTETTSVRFFAVDAAGNAETAREAAYVLDRLGPAAITDFTATPDGDDVDLAWTNPTTVGFADVVVARVTDVSTTVTVDGDAYAVGDTLGASTIVYVGSAESFTDTARGPGYHTYVAWAHHDTGVYAEGRTAATRIATPTQTCQITVDVTGGTATVATQPPDFTLAVSGYANTGGAISFDVAVTSGLAGITFNPKLVLTTVAGTGGTPTVDNADGTVDTDSYFYYGPEGLLDGATATRSVALTANAATAITLDCEVVEDAGIFYAKWECPIDPADSGGLFDTRTHAFAGGLPGPTRFGAVSNECNQWQSQVLSPDRRYLYVGPRGGKAIAKIDTTTFAAVGGLDITVTSSSASAGRVSLDPSGRRLYVGVNDGSHGGAADTGASETASAINLVLEVAAADMSETHRLQVGAGTGKHRLLRATPSPDGRILGVTFGHNSPSSNRDLQFYDISTWTRLDAGFTLGAIMPTNIAYDGASRYAVIGSGGPGAAQLTFGLVELDTMTMQTLTAPEDRPVTATWDGDSFFLWVDGQQQLHKLDPVTAIITSIGNPGDVTLSATKAARRIRGVLWVQGQELLTAVDPTSGLQLTGLGSDFFFMHTIAATE